jgi:hypothetical protein
MEHALAPVLRPAPYATDAWPRGAPTNCECISALWARNGRPAAAPTAARDSAQSPMVNQIAGVRQRTR